MSHHCHGTRCLLCERPCVLHECQDGQPAEHGHPVPPKLTVNLCVSCTRVTVHLVDQDPYVCEIWDVETQPRWIAFYMGSLSQRLIDHVAPARGSVELAKAPLWLREALVRALTKSLGDDEAGPAKS